MREIIQKLHISEPEKDIYIICIEVLEDDAFESFFHKISQQLEWDMKNLSQREPLELILQ